MNKTRSPRQSLRESRRLSRPSSRQSSRRLSRQSSRQSRRRSSRQLSMQTREQEFLNAITKSSPLPKDNTVIGVNFEAGKIIEHVRKMPNCLAYANCQISMDAPFSDRVADDTVRNVGRSELAFVKQGYDESKLIAKFKEILRLMKTNYLDKIPQTKMVIQIARGKAAKSTLKEVIEPVLEELKIVRYKIVIGYRNHDYYKYNYKTAHGTHGEPFVFVNYGMFGVLSNVDKIGVGEICNPVTTYSITSENKRPKTGKVIVKKVEGSELRFGSDPRNILNDKSLGIRKIKLYGIDDDMLFITPDKYDVANFESLYL